MKKKNFYIRFGSLMMAATMAITSCDNNFEELNANPDASLNPTPAYLLTKAEIDAASDLAQLLSGTVQYTTSFNNVAGFGSKYINSQIGQTWALFNTAYPREVNNIGEVLRATAGKPEYVNINSAARIIRVYIFHRLTDMYGDIPYFDAGKGLSELIYKPKYDTQEAIYNDMFKELEQANAAFNTAIVAPAPGFTDTDILYGGDLAKWKKFSNSLMLRLAMRLAKVNLTLAEQMAKKAIAAGVIADDVDITRITYPGAGLDTDKNPLALNLWNSDYIKANGKDNTEGGKYHEAFIKALKDENDPRLPVLSIVWKDGKPNNDPALQIGMPPTADGSSNLPSPFITYSEPNPKTVLNMGGNFVLLGLAEVKFLLAEAAIRGWYTGDTPDELYADGIRAAMRQIATMTPANTDAVIASTAIETYVTNHPLSAGTDDQKLEQIYTQFWLGIFPNSAEAYSTWRRTGYPKLVPNNFTGNATNGQIFRRFQYPSAEQNLNPEGYNAAVNALKAAGGNDDIVTRVWWDKAQ